MENEVDTKLKFVCKVGLNTSKAGSFMYYVIKWNVKILSSCCVGCKQYTKEQMSRGQAEVMVEFRNIESKDGFVKDTGLTMKEPATILMRLTEKGN